MRYAIGPLVIVLVLATSCDGAQEDVPDRAQVVAVADEIASAEHPVFYVHDTEDRHRLMAYDWTGEHRGEVLVSSSEPFGVYPSPDGTRLLITHGHVVRGGRVVGSVSRGTWADDEHVCTFLDTDGKPGRPVTTKISDTMSTGHSTPGALFLQTTDGEMRKVADYGVFGEHGGPEVLACSVPDDRAVVAQSFVGQRSNVTVVRLTDGEILYEGPTDAALPADVVSSQDGSLLAEGATGRAFGSTFAVRHLATDQVVAQVSGGGAVTFSGDNSRVLIVRYLNGGNEMGEYRVIELATGRVAWSAVLSPGSVLTRPASGDFLVASRSWESSKTRPNGNDAFEDVWLVPEEGPARVLLSHVVPLQ